MRHGWTDLPDLVRRAVERAAGTVHRVEHISSGSVADFAAVLDLDQHRVFCKGLQPTARHIGSYSTRSASIRFYPLPRRGCNGELKSRNGYYRRSTTYRADILISALDRQTCSLSPTFSRR